MALVLASTIAIAWPATASAGDPLVSLKVSKQKDGPYKPVVHANVALNEAKDFYWKVRNVSEFNFAGSVRLFDDGPYPPSWVARWFRGDNNITPDVRGDGYEFSLKAHRSKHFRSRLKPTMTADALCHSAGARFAKSSNDFALVVVNDAICIF